MPGTDDELRLAELVAAFSLGTDLGLGQPMEHVLRCVADRRGARRPDRARRVGARAALLRRAARVGRLCRRRARGGDLVRRRHRVPGRQLRRRSVRAADARLHAGARRRGRPGAAPPAAGLDARRHRGQAVQRGLMSHCISTARARGALRARRRRAGAAEADVRTVGRQGRPAGLGGEQTSRSRSACSTWPTSSRCTRIAAVSRQHERSRASGGARSSIRPWSTRSVITHPSCSRWSRRTWTGSR